jgi:hypothetical protein
MSKICDTSVLFCMVLSCPCFNQSNNIFFYFGYLLHIIASVPRAFGHCAPVRTVLCTEVSMFFFERGARLQATALRAVYHTLASIPGGDFTVRGQTPLPPRIFFRRRRGNFFYSIVIDVNKNCVRFD